VTAAGNELAMWKHLVADAERKARQARSELRALELATGRTLDEDEGRYWLRRVWVMENLVTAVERGDVVGQRRLLEALRGLPVPVCNENDRAADVP
jgi:hypothetical protein